MVANPAVMDEAARRWWQAIDDGRLELQACSRCHRRQHPPGPLCRTCASGDHLSWVEHPGHGHVVAASEVHATPYEHLRDDGPYWVALVELEPDVLVLTNIIGLPESTAPAARQCVSLRLVPRHGRTLPVFAAADGACDG